MKDDRLYEVLVRDINMKQKGNHTLYLKEAIETLQKQVTFCVKDDTMFRPKRVISIGKSCLPKYD